MDLMVHILLRSFCFFLVQLFLFNKVSLALKKTVEDGHDPNKSWIVLLDILCAAWIYE